jgi:hypothetical protein
LTSREARLCAFFPGRRIRGENLHAMAGAAQVQFGLWIILLHGRNQLEAAFVAVGYNGAGGFVHVDCPLAARWIFRGKWGARPFGRRARWGVSIRSSACGEQWGGKWSGQVFLVRPSVAEVLFRTN